MLSELCAYVKHYRELYRIKGTGGGELGRIDQNRRQWWQSGGGTGTGGYCYTRTHEAPLFL